MSDMPQQLVILSGKGGTGKTAVAAAFARLAHAGSAGAVLVDADVDAANLELLLQPEVLERHEYSGGSVAWIDPTICSACGVCEEVCRFGAIRAGQAGAAYEVDSLACEGCASCFHQCPDEAIRMNPQLAGDWFRSHTGYGPLFHARLRPAQENSGKLVSLIRQRAQHLAVAEGYDLMVVDGPPGIGCPAIAASTGADLALIVAEPTLAGIHDLERVLDMIAHFQLRGLVCVNKCDLYEDGVRVIESRCSIRGVEVVGRIPFDGEVTRAMVMGRPVTAHAPDAPASLALGAIWQRVLRHLIDVCTISSSGVTIPVAP
jgi:MinD superfamily P-loop ATPase